VQPFRRFSLGKCTGRMLRRISPELPFSSSKPLAERI
jgi:hypothetical protein